MKSRQWKDGATGESDCCIIYIKPYNLLNDEERKEKL